jgi:hypothetical protein
MKPKQPKRVFPPRVQVYFRGNSSEVYNDLIELSKVTHRSASEIMFSCFVQTFYDPQMRDAILRGSGVSAVEVKKLKK